MQFIGNITVILFFFLKISLVLCNRCSRLSLTCIDPIIFLLISNQIFVCLFSDHLFSRIPLPQIILAPYKQSVDLVIRCAVQNQSKYCWCCQPFHVCVICFGVGPGLSGQTPARPLSAQGTRHWLLDTCSGGLDAAPLLSPVYTWQRGKDLLDEALFLCLTV